MKKRTMLLLAALFLFSMAGCQSEQTQTVPTAAQVEIVPTEITPPPEADPREDALEAADALLEQGDYDSAIKAYTALGNFSDAPEKLAEATSKKDEPYYGTWINLYDETVFTFSAEGKATADGKSISYARDGSTLTITGINLAEHPFFTMMPLGASWPIPGENDPIPLTIVDEGGIRRMYCNLARIYLVPEDQAEALSPIAVDITMENWQEYFYSESSEAHNGPVGDFPGQCPEGTTELYVWLKEAYCNRLMNPWKGDGMYLDVTFVFQYNTEYFTYSTEADGTVSFTSLKYSPFGGSATRTQTQLLSDYRMLDFQMSGGSRVYCRSFLQEVSGNYYYRGADFQLVDVSGTLLLVP